MKKVIGLAAVAIFAVSAWFFTRSNYPHERVGELADTQTQLQSNSGEAAKPHEQSALIEIGDDESELETVNGLLVRKDRNCTVTVHYLPNDDGTVSEAFSCVPNNPTQSHAYTNYSNESLLQLSYHDAKAAEILGMRMRDIDHQMALRLVVRASALLGGNAEMIQSFSNAYPVADTIDGMPVQETVRKKYVLSKVADYLGAENNNLDYWQQRVGEAFEDGSQAISELDEQARLIVQEMHSIEIQVKGRSNIEPRG